MSDHIYKLAILRSYREAYYQLSDEERQGLWQRVSAVAPSCGGTLLIACNSRWCDESVYGWAIYGYTDVAAIQSETAELESLNWYRYVDVQTFLGTLEAPVDRAQFDAPAAVYHLAIFKNLVTESMATVSEEDQARLAEAGKSLEECGGKTLIVCNIQWSNEECTRFLVQSYPSIEARQKHVKDCDKLGLYRYINVREILGTKM